MNKGETVEEYLDRFCLDRNDIKLYCVLTFLPVVNIIISIMFIFLFIFAIFSMITDFIINKIKNIKK